MRWFYKWLDRKIQSSRDTLSASWGVTVSNSNRVNSKFERSDGINFIVHNAAGGQVIEYSSYDKKRDEWDHKMRVVTESDDIGDVISKILIVEMLSK